MEESQDEQNELEELITRRLINEAERSGDTTVKPDTGDSSTLPFLEGKKNVEQPEQRQNNSHDDTDDARDITAPESQLQPTTFAKIEKSLAALGFFTPSSRRLKNEKVKRISFTREMEGKRVEVTAEIVPSAMFGLPVTADQDKYLALQKIITDLQASGEVTNPIRFKSAELLRLLNRNTKAGKNYKEISEWLDVMSSTTIISNGVVYIAGQKRFARDRFRVFDRAVSIGKELDDGTIADANYVWLSSWQLQNINHNFLLPIDLEAYRQLKNHIAKALVPLLQIWLFASHRAGSFEKRYDELCEVLNIQKFPAPSQILRQLKPSLDELTRHQYLEKWQIEKTSDRKAYKIIFFHGAKFHRDRRKRLEQKQHTEAGIIIAQSEPNEPNLPEPGKLPTPPETATAGESQVGVGKVSSVESKLVEELAAVGLMPAAASKLLRSIPAERLETVGDYIDYWKSESRTKNVKPGLLYTLIKNGDPLPANFETRGQREERLAADDRRQKLTLLKDILTTRYEEHRHQVVDRFIAEEFPPEEFEHRVAARKREAAAQTELWNRGRNPELIDQMARSAVRAEIAKDVNVLPYEDFRRREMPRILAELQLDPAELGIQIPKTDTVPQPENTSQKAV